MELPDRLPDRYRPVRLLGEGGAGRVWLVEDGLRDGQKIALKELISATPARIESLRREFVILRRLHHPNLVATYDLEFDTGSRHPLLGMEWIEGMGVVEAIKTRPADLPLLGAEALRALAFLHDIGIVHRDLKPGNLMVRSTPRLGARLVLLDFGLALHRQDDLDPRSRTAGTLPYLAPELFDGGSPGPRSDLYALGAVLFEGIHGHPPFRLGKDIAGFIDAVRAGRRSRPTPPEGYPTAIGEWLEQMLDPDPTRRPGSAYEALAGLNAACGTDLPHEIVSTRAARLNSGTPAGREREAQELWDTVSGATASSVTWVCGSPGSGRQRMLAWLSAEAVSRGWDIVHPPAGRLSPDAEDTPASVVDELLDRLRNRAARNPAVLVLEHVDRAGQGVQRLLERVAFEAHAAPLRVVAALRPDSIVAPGVQRLLARTQVLETMHRIDLGPLDEEALRTMIARVSGRTRVSASHLRWLTEASNGDPLLAETLLVDGAWQPRRSSPDAATVDTAVSGRVDALKPRARRTLAALALAEDSLAVVDLTRILERTRESLRLDLQELVTLGWVWEREDRFAIAWRPLAAAARESTGITEYESLVRRILDTLSPRAGIDVSRMTMARLWTILDERERAIDAALLAARSASDANDPVLAAQRMGYVLRTLRRNDDRRIEFRDRQANLLHEAGLYRAAARAYASVVRWGSTPATRAQASARRAMAIVLAGNFDLGRTFALDALELAATVDDPPSRALANEAIGMALARQGRGRDALPYLDAARSGFESAADNLALAHVHQSIGMCMANEGLPDAGDHFRQAISLAEADGNPANLPCLIGLGVLEQRAGRYVSARTLLERARLAAGKNRRLLLEGVARGTLAQLSVYTGHLAEAISLAAETDDLGRHLGDRRLQLVAATARAQALVRCGRTYEASTLLEKRLSAPNLQIDPVMIEAARLARIEAELAANRPEYERLATAISESIARAESLGDPDTLLWARTLEIELRVATDAEGSLERLLHGYESLAAREGSWRQPWFDLRVALARASRGVRRGRAVQSRELLERVIARADELDLPVVRAEAWAVMTRVAQALEDETLARKALDHGRRALDLARERVADDGLSGGLSERTVFQPLREPPPIGDSPINRRLVALYEMIRALNSESDPDQLLETMLDMALEVVGADRGMILLRDQLSGEFAVRVLRNVDHDTIDDGRRFSRHIVAEAAKGKSVIALDAQNDQRFLEWPSVSLHSIQSLMCAPLRSRGHITGAVYLDSREGSRPFDMGSLRFLEAFANHAALALENARQFASLHVQNLDLRAAAEQRATFGSMVGQSSVMQQVFDLIRQVADSELPVLIQGESGTGKELVAQAIHYNGARGKQTFVSENCAAIPDSLLQSELFGHVRGAFTGAEHDRQGLFEQTHGGSLFLDEVGDMSTTMQAQLLRAIQEGEVRRVGSDTPIQVDVRLIAATHRDLAAEVEAGRFREDLMYRMQVLMIRLPALRDRHGDIPLLTAHFLARIARGRKRTMTEISTAVMERFENCRWPGNIRQLENVLQRLSLLAGDGSIDVDLIDGDASLGALLPGPAAVATRKPDPVVATSLSASERDRIREALAQSGGNRTQAARMLGISRATIYRKLREYEI